MLNRPQFMIAHLCSQDRTWSSSLGQEFARRYPQAYQRYAKTDKLWLGLTVTTLLPDDIFLASLIVSKTSGDRLNSRALIQCLNSLERIREFMDCPIYLSSDEIGSFAKLIKQHCPGIMLVVPDPILTCDYRQ